MKTVRGFALIPVLVVAFLVLGLGVSLYASQQNQNLAKRASEENPNPQNCKDGEPLGTCVTGCPAGTHGTCGGHIYCEGGQPGGCSCETEGQTCVPDQIGPRSCPGGTCWDGNACSDIPAPYRECTGCPAGQSRLVTPKRGSGEACTTDVSGCSADAACTEQTGGKDIADVNHDGVVDFKDAGPILDNFGKPAKPGDRFDINKDGTTNIVDLGIFIDHLIKK